MTVVRLSSREGRSIVEAVLWLAFGELLLGLERINLVPVLENIGLAGRDVDGFGG